jgi:hypothetical protein
MSRPNEAEPPRDVVARYFPYGRAGWSVGRYARGVVMALADVRVARGHHRYWTQTDYRSFGNLLSMERTARDLRMSPDVPFDDRRPIAGQLNELLATAREAMPHSEAERRWLADKEVQLGSRTDQSLVTGLNMAEGEIISAGIRRTVQGRELTNRWWMWRRQIGEFEGQGTREVAYEALRGLGEMLVPEDRHEMERAGLPYTYIPQRL